MKIVIFGAGAAGLTAAWDLVKAGEKVTLVEQCVQPGGLCQTFEKEGFRFDLGGHRFITKNQQLEFDMCQLLGSDLEKRTRKSVILFEGKEFHYPLRVEDILKNLGWKRALFALMSYLKNQGSAQKKLNRDTFEGWARINFGDDLYHKFFGPYTSKLWGIPPHELASDWAGQRISLLNLSKTMLHLFALTKEQPRTYALEYYYPRKGIGQMFTRLAEEVLQLGGEIFYQTQVKKIIHDSSKIVAVQVQKKSELLEIEADYFISTIPLADAVTAFSPAPPASILKHAESLQYRSLRCLNFMIDQDNFGDITWRYVADRHRLMTRLQEPKQRSVESAPLGKTSLMLEMPCFQGDFIWNATEEELLPRVFHELKELGFSIEQKVLGFFSTRTTHAYPLFRLGYQFHRNQLLHYLQPWANFFTCGRQGTFRYIFQDTAQLMGRAVARQILVGSKNQDELQLIDAQSQLQEIQTTTAG